jgi:Bifunctional DNA primase/polymerase, N-terminal
MGWAVFPCHTVDHGSCSCCSRDCSSPGKHPRIGGGFTNAATTAGEIEQWWRRWPNANIGIRTGAASGIVVIDIDTRHGGMRSLTELMRRHDPLPADTPRVRTGSGGWHLFFRHPGSPVPNSAGRLGPGVDVRGDGGYVIAPPSRHVSGRAYRWEIGPDRLGDLPGWLHNLAVPQRSPVRSFDEPIRVDRAVGAWARSALDGERHRVATAADGTRNATLNRAAFSLGQIVGAGVLDEYTVETALVAGAMAAGLSEREALATIRSGMRAGTQHPRAPEHRSQDVGIEP